MQHTKIERIRRALDGEAVDRPPISFWAHNFARENTAEELAAETVRVFRSYDWDFIKIQSRASCFAETWGNQYDYSNHLATPPTERHWAIHTVADLQRIQPADPIGGSLGEQIEALRLIRQEVGPDVPILQTVFAPAMVLASMTNGQANLLEYVQDRPQATHAALAAIRDTLAGYAQASVQNGADGIFLAIKAAGVDQMSPQEYAQFGLPYDRPVLDAASAGWLNLIHLCGDQVYFDVLADLPSPLVSYDALSPHNPSLSEGQKRAQRAVIGGVSPKPQIRQMSPEQVAAEVSAALEDTGGTQMMIGPGCSISPDTPEVNLRAAKRALAEWASR